MANNEVKKMKEYGVIRDYVANLANKISDYKLRAMFLNCFFSTLDTTVETLPNDETYVFTGDIPAMWLRDSSAQVMHYLPYCGMDNDIKHMIRGLIRRQMRYIRIDPYANAFNRDPNGRGFTQDITDISSPWVWERKYELDSLCYPLWLSYKYFMQTQDGTIFNQDFIDSVNLILKVMTIEQNHTQDSSYIHMRSFAPETDSVPNNGKGRPVKRTGMVFSAYRPSDDCCTYGYLVPSNMFAVSVLKKLCEICDLGFLNADIYKKAAQLAYEIDEGIKNYAIIEEGGQKFYAYEVDGFGNYVFMDDANVPSLLASPYLGYSSTDDPIYITTRKRVLSDHNQFYFTGSVASGIGSPHTPAGYIWHIGLCVQALTSCDTKEVDDLIRTLLLTDGGMGYMHEGFDGDNPNIFTREWFAWANSMFAYTIQNKLLLVQ